ncbi:MAG: DUF1573 domain-containing protein [Opitutaceae bacterium]|nr:DUF1573 domain-containing protein [Opitutaceae bacterium]
MNGYSRCQVVHGARRWCRFGGCATALLALVLALPAAESAGPSATAGVPARPLAASPRIQFVELTHDFGEIKRPEIVAHTFVFSNVGNATLEVMDVQLSCGCTTVGDWDRQVAPGGTGRIPIQLSSVTLSGAVTRAITVSCNDPLQPRSVLRLNATVLTPIDVNPSTVIFQFTTENTKSETKTVRIVNRQAEPLILETPGSSNPAFKVALRMLRPGQEFELGITTEPPSGSGAVSSAISVKTSSPGMPLITVPAHAMTRPSVVVSPAQIDLPVAPLAGGLNSSVSIMGMAADPLVLSEPKVNFSGGEVELRELQPGRLFSLRVSFPAGFALPQNTAAELTVKSNHPRFPVIRIPITQSGGPAR